MSEFSLTSDDRTAIEQQLGRPLRGQVRVAVRCACGVPAVVETHPLLDGEPFPTLFWLTCRRATQAVGRLESTGAISVINERLQTDEVFRDALVASAGAYVERRDAHHRLEDGGGIGGGPPDRVKCLHAHLAHELASGGNPVGAWVLEQIGDVLHAPPCVP